MEKSSSLFYIILASCLISLITAVPVPQGGDDMNDMNEVTLPHFMNQNVDYNAMMSHFKDFFMYLPVMFTTFRETMSGFPKLAEGIRILTSPNYEKAYEDESECKCKNKSMQNGNEIDKSSHLF